MRVKRRLRRRREDYTPEQEAATQRLHNQEAWVQVLCSGIAEGLKREPFCTDGIRRIINIVNTELGPALINLDGAHKEHDLVFDRPGRAAATVKIVPRSGKNPAPKRGPANPGPRRKP